MANSLRGVQNPRPGRVLIFRAWRTDPKTGKKILPPPGSKAIPMWVKRQDLSNVR